MSRLSEVRQRQVNVLMFRLDLLRELGTRRSARRLLDNVRHRRRLPERNDRVAGQMWRAAAEELGAEVRQLAPALLEFRAGGVITRVRGQTTPFVDPVSEALASDKPLAYRLLEEAGVAVPRHALVPVGDLDTAIGFLERLGGPCIVKPARGSGGNGVTGEVRNARQMRRALVSAARYNHEALLEQQCSGDSYRLLLLDGEVLGVLRRPRPQVVGDGQSTIETLMSRQYAERIESDGPAGLKPFMVDLDCLFTLEHAGLTVTSVLNAGACAHIKTATNYNGAKETIAVPPPYADSFTGPARRAASVLGVRLAGVDIVAQRDGTAAVVLEVNPIPGLTHHYNVADGVSAPRVAVAILDALLGTRRSADTAMTP
ncbi:MAG: hypothetical protein QOF83_1708 [Solirubrobacteraceae bacterium]|jgi:cyanophycin synthetase|nr:hypothetical protein [Solirubrobacteraceae bacterium]